MSLTIIIGYFARQDEARKALKQLAGQGLRSAVLIHKGLDGVTQTVDQFPRRRSLWTVLAAILSGGIGGITAYSLYWLQLIPAWAIASQLALILLCGAIGGVVVSAFFRRERFGVKLSVMHNHTRWLVSGESRPDPQCTARHVIAADGDSSGKAVTSPPGALCPAWQS